MSTGKITSPHRALAFVLVAIAAALTAPGAARAATYTVDVAGDVAAGSCTAALGDCSLRDAVDAANANGGPDVIDFSSAFTLSLDSPLPAVTDPLVVNAVSGGTTLAGTAAYAAATNGCTDDVYAFDLTAPAASPSSIRGLPIFDVCNKAIRSNVAPPTIKVGPRRFDNTVSVTGQAAAGASVDLFTADGPDTGSSEADSLVFSQLSAPAGAFSYTPGVEPSAGDTFTALQSTASGGSNFAARAVTPADLVSPALVRAVAVGNSTVRLDFSEAIAPASAAASAFSLSVAGVPRAVASTVVAGASVFLESSVPWKTGEAGSALLTGTVRVTDESGNEVLGQPAADVAAGPGEAIAPQITSMRASPNRLCKKVTRRCRRGSTSVLIALNKPARVIFEVRRRSKRAKTMVTFVRRLNAGRNRVKLTAIVSGKQLPRAVLVLRATAQDVARTMSPPAETLFRIVDDKRDL